MYRRRCGELQGGQHSAADVDTVGRTDADKHVTVVFALPCLLPPKEEDPSTE